MKNKGIITGIILIFLGFTAFILTREVIIDQPAPPQKPKPQKQKAAAPVLYPLVYTNGNVKLILTDFTRALKPDNQCRATVCKEFVSLVNGANSTIDMAVFGWEDVPAVTTALQSALERDVQIRLVYDQQPYYPNTGELAALIENSVPNSNPNALMHNKFAVFDGQKVFTGSMNFSTTGFSGFNANSVLVINSADAAKRFTQEFERLYEGNAQQVRGDMQIYFSPQDKITTNHIVPLINAASQYIYVPAFIITHGGFAQGLIDAKARGVDVKVIIDATNPVGSGSKIGRLREAGVAVKTENYSGKMHSKSVIIDDKYVVIGSMNFSNSGEGRNAENVVILADAGVAEFYRGYFEYLWAKIPERYLRINPRAEGKWSIGSCEDGIDNNFDGKIDAADVGCQ